MQMKTYTVEGMDCADCARHVQEGVEKLAGAEQVRVDFSTGLLHFEGEVPFKDLNARVMALGYRLAAPGSAEAPPSPGRPVGAVAGFASFLLARVETSLALAGGGMLLLSLLVSPLGLPGYIAAALQLAGLGLAGYPVARSGLANLWINHFLPILLQNQWVEY